MYHLLLVDNESAVLDGLTQAINWDELGFERIDRAMDGLSAWQMMSKTHYDLVVSDIRMPQMDGLELLSRIAQAGYNTRVIMLTAYDQFDYVLKALRLGASNYLMKPIDPSELRASVIDALGSLAHAPAAAPLPDQSMFEEYFLHRWLSGDAEYRDLSTRSSLAGINIFMRSYNTLLLRNVTRSNSPLPSLIRLNLGTICEVWYLRDHPGEYAFVVGGRDTGEETIKRAIVDLSDNLRVEGAVLIIGQSVSSYKNVCDAYQGCLLAAQDTFLINDTPIICASELTQADYSAAPLPELDAASLFDIPDDQAASELLGAYIQKVCAENERTRIEALMTELALSLIRALLRRLSTGADLPDSLRSLPDQIRLASSAQEIAGTMNQALADARACLKSISDQYSPLVQRAVNLISQQYARPVSLNQIAQQCGTNANYLGFLFHQETGEYFSDYLNGIRIREAQRLLRSSEQSISSVAEATGYSSVNYFCQVFKKLTSQSPARYRNGK